MIIEATSRADCSCRQRRADVAFLARLLSLFAVLVLAPTCFAANHVVDLQDAFPPNHMLPNDLTIAVGDTVTFRSQNNSERHNVHALDDSFRCSLGCRGDSSGASSEPVSKDWSSTVRFTKPGIVKYGCDAHPGTMTTSPATIKVVAQGIALGGYMSGNWYMPNQGGQGFQIEFTNAMDTASGKPIAVAIWFVYAPDGAGQNWIYAQGTYDAASGTVTLPAILLGGARFPPNFNPADVHEMTGAGHWGTLTFAFADCNNGTVSWHSDVQGYNSANDTSTPIIRLTQVAGTSCPQ
ncbi:MAG: hypothetical protein JSR27_03710 [Proteobacteria bacterium]|nr:hypothetical protein [Pseudomonadota bacterium]